MFSNTFNPGDDVSALDRDDIFRFESDHWEEFLLFVSWSADFLRLSLTLGKLSIEEKCVIPFPMY